ncbi:MAG: hypothetical protein KTR15_08145 [Phycisphaeraceae bacterium]|nr:hypothetical protein [Phycisphaeraceae bacterium]
MPIHIDDQPSTLSANSMRELLAAVRDELAPSGRVVVEVRVDGQPITGPELDDDQPTQTTSDIRVYSAKPSDLVVGILEDVRTQLAASQQMQQQAADLLQQDDPAEAMGLVKESINAWLQAQQAVGQSAQLLQLDLQEIKVEGQPVIERMTELIASLTELKDIVVANDFVTLADALQYEWPEITDRWDAAIGAIVKHIEDADAG